VSDKRVHPRVPLSAPLRYLHADGTASEGQAHDISLGGMFVEAASAPAFGAQITIELTLPGDKVVSKLPAVVRWSKPGGFGVQFGLLGARETHQITQLIRRP
jgi:type IV pilus assembly protein PilZ